MSLAELQALVDRLAETLEMSILLESAAHQMIVYSGPEDAADEIRRTAILRRQVPQVVTEYNRAAGVYRSTVPMRLRIPPELVPGHLERVAIPARYRDRLMGTLWIIDDEARLIDEQMRDAVKTAEHLSVLLYEEDLAERLKSGILAHLLSPVEELRAAAVLGLADEGFPVESAVVVGVVQPVGVDDSLAASAIAQGLDEIRLRLPLRHVRTLARPDHIVALLRADDEDEDEASAALEVARQAVFAALPPEPYGARVIAATGDRQARLADATTSYQQARLAVRIARAIPTVGDTCDWAALGAFRALVQLRETEAGRQAVDPRLTPLFAERHFALLRTLETFLDLAGDVKATAARLHLHRGTLYYRLDRVTKLTGIDLNDGLDRLAVHIGIKVARLWNLLPQPSDVMHGAETVGRAGASP